MGRLHRDSGIYDKFLVERTDGRSSPGEKHYRCDYFVLDWEHDPFAVPAARAYAKACADQFPQLAKELRARATAEAKRWRRAAVDAREVKP